MEDMSEFVSNHIICGNLRILDNTKVRIYMIVVKRKKLYIHTLKP